MNNRRLGASLKALFIGRARELSDQRLFHKLSLVAVLAWVGLGADGLSSSCYGPEETFRTLGTHSALSVFVALGCVITIFVICAGYRQIIELFPSGGGGYLVASKLLSPAAGVVSGSALLVDYVLTIAISVASGADALFSIVPASWQPWKLALAGGGVVLLTVLNLRGVKESVLLWAPIFFLFVGTHAVAILVAIFSHVGVLPAVVNDTARQLSETQAQLGWFGLLALMLKAYSMGAGTYTGIEAVSNGLPILREPRVETGKRTMTYMAVSLAITVFGLLLAYLLYAVEPVEGKTLNAVLFEKITASWPGETGRWFVTLSLTSAMALLFIAAQAGFLDGPRVLANMALDRWFPTRFAALSDRFVTQKGILLMGGAALLALLITRGAVALLVVLYSINVFITFSLSQFGMVLHWWRERGSNENWKRKLAINGIGFCLTTFILVSICVVKFTEGGWITLVITGALIAVAFAIKRHYLGVQRQLTRLNEIVEAVRAPVSATQPGSPPPSPAPIDPKAKTAVLLVNGFNGLGLHTLLQVRRLFAGTFTNFVFVQVGVVDAGNFKGGSEMNRLQSHIRSECDQYVAFIRRYGQSAEAFTALGRDVVEEITKLAPQITKQYPNAVFFSGQLVFERETVVSRWLHNDTVFALQREFCLLGLPFVTLPIRVSAREKREMGNRGSASATARSPFESLAYQHTQTAPELAVIALVTSLALCIAAVILPLLFLGAGLVLFVTWLFRSFTIEIADGELQWRFGGGWIRRHVELSDIVSASVVRTAWLDGWGVLYSTFGRLYNVSGFNAVAITLRNGRRICLGTDEPEALVGKLLATDEHNETQISDQSSSSRSA